jgi:hypothetical protein
VAAKPPIALGLKVRTGHAVVVALRGSAAAPEVAARTRVDLATTFEEGAVYHAAEKLALQQAQTLIEGARTRFVEGARAELDRCMRSLPSKPVAFAMVAPPPKALPALATILRAHPLIHAAEIELYRDVFQLAVTALGGPPLRIPEDALAPRAASALHTTQARLTAHLTALGKVAGKPWAVHQKQATLAAWIALAQT